MPDTADYIRIADEIIADVRSKKLKPGDKLPSIAELRRDVRGQPRRPSRWPTSGWRRCG